MIMDVLPIRHAMSWNIPWRHWSGENGAGRSEYARKLELCIKSEGPNLSPMDSWLMLRSIKTLGLRVECQAARALEIARWLQA